jgi:undecaprenyl-phosphate 4-deoxy-4-formamido-L-arabinose transferase
VITIDDDLQHAPEDLPALYRKAVDKGSDIMYAIDEKATSAERKMFKHLAKNLNGSTGKGSSFRVIKKEVAEKLSSHRSSFVFIDELIPKHTSSIEFTVVKFNTRRSGKSGYGRLRLFNLTNDLIIFYSPLPTRIMTVTGAFISSLSFIFGCYILILHLFFNASISSSTALITMIAFASGALLLCVGILGEHIRRMYDVYHQIPHHHISEVAE